MVLIPLLERQWELFTEYLPPALTWISEVMLPWIEGKTGMALALDDMSALEETITAYWQQAGSWATGLVVGVSRSTLTVFVWLINLVLIPVVMFYLLRDWPALIAQVKTLLPKKIAPQTIAMFEQCDEVLSAFIRGQLLVMLLLGIVYATGLWWVGLNLALFIGLFAGLLSVVPYLGFLVGIVIALVVALIQFQDVSHLVWVALVFGMGNVLESMVFIPWLVGDKIGLHPVAVIFAVLAGGQLFGFVGILLALPVAAVLMVMVRYIYGQYQQST